MTKANIEVTYSLPMKASKKTGLFSRFFSLMTISEKKGFVATIALLILVALAELASVSLILPFTAIIMNPDMIMSDSRASYIYKQMGAESPADFLTTLGGILLICFIGKSLFCAYADGRKITYARQFEMTLMSRLLKSYLQNNFSFFVKNPPSALYHNLVGQIPEVTTFLNSFLSMLTAASVGLAITSLFIIVSPLATFILFSGCIFIVVLNLLIVRKALRNSSQKIEEFGLKRGRAALQGLNGMKDIKIFNNESYFFSQFNSYNRMFTEAQIVQQKIQQIQFRFLEPTALATILAVLSYFIHTGKSIQQYVPILALFVAGIMRLLPSVAQIVSSINGMRHGQRFIDIVHDFLMQSELYDAKEPEGIKFSIRSRDKRLTFSDAISIDIRSFSYESRSKDIFRDFRIRFDKGRMIGLVGSSGCGKTTLIDILLGLYPLSDGAIYCDNRKLTPEEVFLLRNNIGYVPQKVFLYDMSILENVAFGIQRDQIDVDRVWKVLELARLKEFVEQLPDSLSTTAGEFGAKFSGGQVQRIGIARALYNDPEILVLDEATSALDSRTESEFNECIMQLRHQKTIIVSAHRMASLRQSDHIYFLVNGEIRDQGTFSHLLQNSEQFSSLVKAQVQ